jgi:2-aminoadipate transaminase
MKTSVLSELAQRTAPPAISWLMQLSLSRPKLISLAAGFTDNESLPVGKVRRAFDAILRSEKAGQPPLQYGSTQGDLELRELTGTHLRQLDHAAKTNPEYSPDRMIITNGSQQLLYLATEALCDPGDIVVVEDPTYFVYLGILQSRGVRARGVRMTREGMDLQDLERVFQQLKQSGELRRVKALYLVSYFQNPTGVTTTLDKKKSALELLRRYERSAGHPIFLLEDGAYRELRFAGSDVPSTLAMNGGFDRVIYTGTYSKPFATGTRVGFGILPEPVFTAVLRLKGNHDFGTSNLLQQLIREALSSGAYEAHVGDLRKRYKRKAEIMSRALEANFPDTVECWTPEGGLYFWSRLPKAIRSGIQSKCFELALKSDVLFVPGVLCYADDPTRRKPDHEVRLSFGGATERDMRTGIARLGTVIKKLTG